MRPNPVPPVVPAASVPFPTVYSLGGVKATPVKPGFAVTGVLPDGTVAQASFEAIASTVPAPTPTTLGHVFSLSDVSSKYVTQVGTDGTLSAAQPAATSKRCAAV